MKDEAKELLEEIKSCIADEEDGAGYLMDTIKRNISLLESVLESASQKNDPYWKHY